MRVPCWLLFITLAWASLAEAAAPKTLLAVFAHPDDETLIGPLLAKYGREGVRVQLVIVTEGEKGIFPHAGIPAGPELAKVRAEEARCSCRALGISAPILLGFKDAELGRISRPPWEYLAQVERELRTLFAKFALMSSSRLVRREHTGTLITVSWETSSLSSYKQGSKEHRLHCSIRDSRRNGSRNPSIGTSLCLGHPSLLAS